MLNIALKEWAIICDLLLEGSLALLLRKGGIHEHSGPGIFRLEHPQFLLFPSWAHQKPEMIKPAIRPRVQVLDEPAEVTFRGWGDAVRIWRVKERRPFDLGGSLDDLLPWTSAQIDMRFNYKPQNPLYLMAVRVHRLASSRTVVNSPEYAGCKSWVPLRPGDVVEEGGSVPALDDAAFNAIVERVEKALA